MNDILGFKTADGTKWLSNFWPCNISDQGLSFDTLEAAFQAAKHRGMDRKVRISKMPPHEAMIEGRQGQPQEGWDRMAVEVMYELLKRKFSNYNPQLLAQLLATGDCRIAETNNWGDLYWGENEVGEGLNVLGRLLMLVRELRRLEALPRDSSTKAHHHDAKGEGE